MRRSAWWIGVAVLALAARTMAEEAMSPPSDDRLLDEVPDYASALAEQWRGSDLPARFQTSEDELDHFGRLRDVPSEKLALDECIRLALSNNTDLQIQRLGPVSARANVRRSLSMFDPSFFGDFSYDRSARPAGNVLAGALITETHNLDIDGGLRKTLLSGGQLTFSWQNNRATTNGTFNGLIPQYTTDFLLSLNQPLLRDFGRRFTTLLVRVAKTNQEAAVYQYEAIVASVVEQVEASYWGLVLANENVNVQEQGLAAAKELQRQNEGKYNVGALPQTAVLEAQAEVARRVALLIQSQNAQTIARDSLRALINFRHPESEALLSVEPGQTPSVVPYDIDLERSLAMALDKRPELMAAKLDVHGKAMQAKVAGNQLLPRLNAVGSLGTNGLGGQPIPRTFNGQTVVTPFGGSYDETLSRAVDGRYYSYSAGVTIEIPFDNAQAKADYARARIDVESSRRNLQKQQETVTLEIKKAVTNLQNDLKSIEATRIARELAEENLRNQKARYDVGLATTKDLLDFLDRLTQAQFAEVQSLTTYSTDLAEMRRSEGSLLSARNIIVDHGADERWPWWASF